MELHGLLELFQRDARVKSVADELQNNIGSKVHLTGVVGSSAAFVATAAYLNAGRSHLFILEDKESAAYFQNDLQVLLPKKDIHFLPDSYRRPGHLPGRQAGFNELNKNNVLQRTEALNNFLLGETRGEMMVTYPEALIEKVVSKKVLGENTISVSTGNRIDIDELIDTLVLHGFERADFVYEPGEFSIRGGIIDIFSYGNDLPYRIELFDKDVESIRLFDPVSQLSQKKVARFSIIPNMQTHFSGEQKVDLLDVIPAQTVVWVKSLATVMGIVAPLAPQRGENSEVDGDSREGVQFSTLKSIEDALSARSLVEFGGAASFPASKPVAFSMTPQPSFNRQFNLLIEDLQRHETNGTLSFIFADNPKQIERYYQIFEDLKAEVHFHPVLKSIQAGFVDKNLKVACYTDHQIINRYHKFNVKPGYSRGQALSVRRLRELVPGDYVTHIDHGVGKYSGLEKIEVGGHLQEAVRLVYADGDLLYVGINALHKIAKFVGKEGKQPHIDKLGSDSWEKLKSRTKRKVKDIAKDLIKLYAARKSSKGFAFAPDTYLQTELEASFIYEDTPDQEKATVDIKRDMEEAHPMDRLICGDVGFGKTELAIRAAFKAVTDGKQAAVLVPTTILAMQHFKTFSERLKDFPCTVDSLSRFKTTAQKKQTLELLEQGKIDIIIGTHALLGKGVRFKDLGLLVVDEEQKFGVSAKERIRQLRLNVDTLTLTATPIPRTLQFSLMGARDLSIINTPPPNRQPIETELHVFSDDILRDAIYYEFDRGGQVFFIHNRVKDIEQMAELIRNLCPDVTVGVAHGQMPSDELEDHMMKFIEGQYSVLVSTNIIESGLDIPNANTIIISNAHQFGLSDLHQLRGRVGRSNKKAFCYLFSPPMSSLTAEARQRLETVEQFSELGSGFNISMRDLDIRGAGNMLGAEQSGFIADIGFDMYHKILDEAVRELKKSDFPELYEEEMKRAADYVRDVTLETDIEMMFPDDYIRNTNERMSLYAELNNVKTEEELLAFREELIDRFGSLPEPAENLLDAIRFQWQAKQLAMDRIFLKNGRLQCYFVPEEDSPFYQSEIFTALLNFIQSNPSRCKLRQKATMFSLIIEDVHSLNEARELLAEMVPQPASAGPLTP